MKRTTLLEQKVLELKDIRRGLHESIEAFDKSLDVIKKANNGSIKKLVESMEQQKTKVRELKVDVNKLLSEIAEKPMNKTELRRSLILVNENLKNVLIQFNESNKVLAKIKNDVKTGSNKLFENAGNKSINLLEWFNKSTENIKMYSSEIENDIANQLNEGVPEREEPTVNPASGDVVKNAAHKFVKGGKLGGGKSNENMAKAPEKKDPTVNSGSGEVIKNAATKHIQKNLKSGGINTGSVPENEVPKVGNKNASSNKMVELSPGVSEAPETDTPEVGGSTGSEVISNAATKHIKNNLKEELDERGREFPDLEESYEEDEQSLEEVYEEESCETEEGLEESKKEEEEEENQKLNESIKRFKQIINY